MISRILKERWALLVLVLLSCLLFFYKLGAKSYWLDEMITLGRTQKGWKLHYSVWPPLYFWMIRIWAKVFGLSEWALRSLSALWGVISVIALYYLGNLIREGMGLWASILLMFNPMVVKYAQEARGYTMVLALLAFSALISVKILRGLHNNKEWLYLAVINIAGSLVHHSFTLFAFFEYLTILMWIYFPGSSNNEKYRVNVLKSFILWSLTVAIYCVLNFKYTFLKSPALSRHTAIIILDLLGKNIYQKAFSVTLIFWSVVLAFGKSEWRKWAFMFFFPIISLFLTSFILKNIMGTSVYRVRYLIPILPLMAIISSYPLANVSFKKSLIVASIWILITSGYLVVNHYNNPETKAQWRESAEWISTHNNGELVVVNWYKYYMYYYLDWKHVNCIDTNKFLKKLRKGDSELEKIDSLWVLYPEGGEWSKNKKMEKILKAKGFVLGKERKIGKRSRILHFVRKAPVGYI